MVLFFRVLTRLFILAFAYCLAVMAAMAALVVSIVGWRANFGGLDGGSPEEEVITLLFSGAFGLIAFFHIGLTAFTPAVVAGLITEAFSWRSIFVHVAAGGVIGLFLLNESGVYAGETPPQQDLVITLAAGFVAGLVYWLIAGRNAGGWRMQTKASI